MEVGKGREVEEGRGGRQKEVWRGREAERGMERDVRKGW
jgi:hypothetical protein